MGFFNDLKNLFWGSSKKVQNKNIVPRIYIDPLRYSLFSTETATMLLKKIQESINIVNNATNPRVFFQRLYFILNQLIYLAQFENKIQFSGELPSTAYSRIVNNLGKTVDDFIKRAYNQELSYSSQINENKTRLTRMINFLSELEYDVEYSDDFCNVAEIDKYYRGKLYTPSNIQTIHNLQTAIKDTYVGEGHSLLDNKITTKVTGHRDISYAPYHILPQHGFIVSKSELNYEYSGKGDFDKSDFYSFSPNVLPTLKSLVNMCNTVINKEVTNRRIPNCVLYNCNNIVIDDGMQCHCKFYYHPIDYYGNENSLLYTIRIDFNDNISNIKLFFDKKNNIIRAKMFKCISKNAIKYNNATEFSTTGYECFLRNKNDDLVMTKAFIHKGIIKDTLFDDDEVERQKTHIERQKTHIEYQKIVDLMGEQAPKSYSGYMRMKNQNTKNFQKIKEIAEQNNIEIQ